MINFKINWQKTTAVVVTALYLFGVSWGLVTNLKRTQALKFQSIDYGMYMQFSAQLADPRLSNGLSANPEGYNIFGLEEIEAKTSINQAIHFEPVKYLYVPLYRVFSGPLGIYLFLGLLHYLPPVYFYRVHPKKNRQDFQLVVLFSLLYVFSAASINSLGFDARPRILLAPAFVLLSLAVHYRRPLIEQLLWLGLLFSIREEAILLAPILIAYTFLRSENLRHAIRKAASLTLPWLLYAAALFFYYRWTGYQNYDEYSSLDFFVRAPWFYIPLGALALAYATYFISLLIRKKSIFNNWWLLLGVYVLGAAFASARFTQGLLSRSFVVPEKSRGEVLLASLRNPDSALLLFTILTLLVMLWQPLTGKRQRQYLLLALTVLMAISLVDSGLVLRNHAHTWAERIPPAEIIFDLRRDTDRYSAGILTDEDTFQVFYDYEDVRLYQRLPWALYGVDKPRYYPQNLEKLGAIVKQDMDYAVVTTENVGDIESLLQSQQLNYSIWAANDRYTIYQIDR